MTVFSSVVTVGTVATQLHNNAPTPGYLHVSNLDNTDTIFIGSDSVVANSGHSLPKNASEDFQIYAGDTLYAISTKSGHSVGVLFIRP